MLFVSVGALERCTPDKDKIKVICPSIWIHYIIDGKGYYNGTPLTAGQAFIVYKNDFCEYFPDKNNPWTYIWIRIEGDDEENLIKRCGIPQKSCVFSFDYKERLAEIIKTVFGDKTAQISNRILGEATAKMILSLHLNGKSEGQTSYYEDWVSKAKAFIFAHYHHKLTVEQIANELHIDRQYLRNLFVKQTGMSTKAYLDNYRMTRAAELLKIKNTSIHIVALSVGYSDPLAFTKSFKKHFGLSPSQYVLQQKSLSN